MTNLNNVISAIRDLAGIENTARFGGRSHVKVDAPKIQEPFIFQNRVHIDWHSGVPNHVCAYSETFDDEHCAAYVYLWQQGDHFACTLRLANEDGAHHEPLARIACSCDDRDIAQAVIASVIAGTQRLKRRTTEAERGVPFSELTL